MKCRHCAAELTLPLVDLGSAPPSNAYLTEERLHTPEKWYPLRVLVCEHCWLAQTEDFAEREELFGADYAYFSSFSTTWLKHTERYVAAMIDRFKLSARSFVVEVGSNDGYLLQYFKKVGIPCLGIEPTASTASTARERGLTIIEDFFGENLAWTLAAEGRQADLIATNNVLAHVPDINDFVAGFAVLLKTQGVATFEFPHLLRLVTDNQFDTIYHEHFSYLSLTAVNRILASNGLTVFEVEEHPTHGGSLRVFAQRSDTGQVPPSARVRELLQREKKGGILTATYYSGFQTAANKIKNDFLSFLLDAKRQGKTIAAYGAAAKGNTIINYAGIRPDLISFVVDRNPEKQGKYMPGSRIPIVAETRLQTTKPDFIVILPWNIKEEIMQQLVYIKSWGGQFVIAIPYLEVI